MSADEQVIYYWAKLLLIAHATLALSLCINKNEFTSFLKVYVIRESELTAYTS